MKIQVYSDIVCPFCYIGKKKLDDAIKQMGLEDVELSFRAFLLNPDSPADVTMSQQEYYKKAYGPMYNQMSGKIEQIMAAAREVGLEFNYEIMQSCNTIKSHRLCKWAGTKGREIEMNIALMDAYFIEGKRLNEDEDLLEKVAQVGLPVEEAREVLTSDAFLAEVKADLSEAQQLGISSVPFFIFENRFAVSGAQPTEVFIKALTEAGKLSQ